MISALICFALIGLYISLYFSFLYYKVIDASSRFVPQFCMMEGNTCQLIIYHPDAALFGVPNSILGVGYYVSVLLCLVLRSSLFTLVMTIISWLAVLSGVYLVYSLCFKIKAACPLCLASHAINAIIAVTLTFWS